MYSQRQLGARSLPLPLPVLTAPVLFFSGRVRRHRQREARIQHGAGNGAASLLLEVALWLAC